MSESNTRVLRRQSNRLAAVGAPIGDSELILCLTDVARLLSCSVEEATSFVERACVPALRMPSGAYRFLKSSVLNSIHSQLSPYRAKSSPDAPDEECEGLMTATRVSGKFSNRKGFE